MSHFVLYFAWGDLMAKQNKKANSKLTERQIIKRQAAREMEVYKRDDMIQKARFDLSIQEQRCVLYAVSMIKADDSFFQEYTLNLKDFYSLCGLRDESYTEIKAILQGLKQKTWWVETSPGVESTVSWFNKVRANKKDGQVTIRFDDDMMPYLLELVKQGAFYTGYKLKYVLPMTSRYSPRLYELLKSYQKNGNIEWFFQLEDLKRLMDAQNYDRWPDFRRRVLEPALNEINEYTDLSVAYVPQKEGKKVVRVTFFMKEKRPDKLLAATLAGTEKLDGQVSIEEVLANMMDPENPENIKRRFLQEE